MLNGARAVKVRLLELVGAGRCGVREQNVTLRQHYRYDTFRNVIKINEGLLHKNSHVRT